MAKFSGVDIHDFGTNIQGLPPRNTGAGAALRENCTALFRRSRHGTGDDYRSPDQDVNRERGASHYGISRTFRVFFDLITIRFLLRYLARPLHFFGTVGILSIFCGMLRRFLAPGAEAPPPADVMVKHGPLMLFALQCYCSLDSICSLSVLLAKCRFRIITSPPARALLRGTTIARAERREHDL